MNFVLDQHRIISVAHGPRTACGTGDSAHTHGWVSGRSISSAQAHCVGGMDVVGLVYTVPTLSIAEITLQ